MGAFLAAVVPLVLRYGPTALSLLKQFGPPVWNALAPLMKASFASGTLPADIARVIAAVEQASPALGALSSLGDLADALGSIELRGAAVEDPAMERAAGPKHGGR